MPLQATSGAASYDAFGGGVPVVPNYIEDVFSTYLYVGNGSTQTITNGIDLSGKGGMVWSKSRDRTGTPGIIDTVRGNRSAIYPNLTGAQDTAPNDTYAITGFNSTGYGLGLNYSFNINDISFGITNYVSWTFRKQPKFFDIVTYTGTGSARTVAHNLGSVPGCILIKSTNSTDNWAVYHRSIGNTGALVLNTTAATDTFYGYWNNTSPTSTQFTVNIDLSVNGSGQTYVAYLFAHDAGGFGLTGTDNVISCGTYTGNGSTSGPIASLGYEPQWLMVKRATGGTGNWVMIDSMRGFVNSTTATPSDAYLVANTSAAESTWGGFTGTDNAAIPLATGFQIVTSTAALNNSSDTYIYIAIRRGPMKVPTSGTSVFSPVAVASSTSIGTQIANSFVTDMAIGTWRDGVVEKGVNDRLRGISTTNPTGSGNPLLKTNTTGAETTPSNIIFQGNGNATMLGRYFAGQGYNQIYWLFGRAPSFFDEVCWTRSTTTATLNHNLGVVPELIIKKDRSRAGTYWDVMPNVSPYDYRYDIYLNDTQAISGPSSIYWNAAPTATTFDVHMGFDGSSNGDTFVAYLFATCAGVSKVGSYTGNGSTQTINCGFTGGARFVIIKATSTTGNWIVADSARGIVAGNDPALYLNSTAAEVTGLDWIDADNSGFVVNETATIAANTNGVSYIFFAVA